MNKPSLTNIIVAVLAAAGFLAIYLGLSKPVLTIPMMEGDTMVKDANETLLPFVKGSALAGIALSLGSVVLPILRLAMLNAGLTAGLMLAVGIEFYRLLQPLTELRDADKVLPLVKVLSGVYWLGAGSVLAVLASLCLNVGRPRR